MWGMSQTEISNNYSVYRHIFPNGKCYIGITSQTLEKRFENGRGYKKCPKMHNAILKYGWNNIEHELLYSGLPKEEAEAKEIELIAFYGSVENGYNTDHGGNTTGTHSIETRNKISIANIGNVTRFYSLRNAAETVGKNVSSLHNAIKKHSFYCGYYWGYENESRS